MRFKALCILAVISSFMSFANDFMAGSWVKESKFKRLLSENYPALYIKSRDETGIKSSGYFEDSCFRIYHNKEKGTAICSYNALLYNVIYNEMDEGYININLTSDGEIIKTLAIRKIDGISISVTDENGEETKFYRLSDCYEDEKPRVGKVKANSMLKTEPSEDSISWTMLNNDYIFHVKREFVEEVEGNSRTWYFIDMDGFPDGWVTEDCVSFDNVIDCNPDKVPLLNVYEMNNEKNLLSSTFFDAGWCVEENCKKQKIPSEIIHYGDGYVSLKDDEILIALYRQAKPFTIILHNVECTAEYKGYAENDRLELILSNEEKTKLVLTKIGINRVKAEFDGKEEIWVRMSAPLKNRRIGKIKYDGTCLFRNPSVDSKTTWLNTGDLVEIIGKTDSKEKIIDDEYFWYKILLLEPNEKVQCLHEVYETVYWVYGGCIEFLN